MPPILKLPNLDDAIRRYVAGESIPTIADSLGCSRTGFTNALRRAGVSIRTSSEAGLIVWSQLTPEERAAQTSAAHQARRGAIDPPERRMARARTRYARCLHSSPMEHRLADVLRLAGVSVEQQFPLGGYNIDVAADVLSVAVEMTTGSWQSSKQSNPVFRQRTEYILNQGWCVVFVLKASIEHLPYATEHLLSFLNAVSNDKSLLGKYGVVPGHPKYKPISCRKLDGLPRIEGF